MVLVQPGPPLRNSCALRSSAEETGAAILPQDHFLGCAVLLCPAAVRFYVPGLHVAFRRRVDGLLVVGGSCRLRSVDLLDLHLVQPPTTYAGDEETRLATFVAPVAFSMDW